ncbi:carboxypeptidase-like regulatory domain-containing protein [Rufibacter sp. H-1]|uniref:Carboxypeptidase-like regulatory domain-containing protein n=1 Tax=Rufibacter sediminis TaxID=2762756 RepID=A0ABR6VRF8_9BACT|nr:DUF5686 family protein [Rufibacter sediminis]MBC3539773.1 carboxypeptidase-like regulatory domain-containing protein [Rufibacter sediminis]
MRNVLLFLFLLMSGGIAYAQHLPVSGKVRDSESQKPQDFVTVHIRASKNPLFTDEAGTYILRKYALTDSITFTLLGYQPVVKSISELQKNGDIALVRQSYAIQEIVIRPQENPAYRIVRAAARNKQLYLPENQEAIQFETYTLMKGSILEREATDKKKGFSKRYAPYLDSLTLTDAPSKSASLPIFQSETVKETFFSRNPRKSKEILKASKVVGVGIERESQIAQLLNAQAEHFSLNQNWMRMFDKDFVSPIANQWANYYDYELEDSVQTESGKVYRLKILPKRAQDLTFGGYMWIADGSFSLRRIELKLNKDVALNFIKDLQIVQAWDEKNPSLLPLSSKRKFQITGLPGSDVRLFVETVTTYTDLVLGEPKPEEFFDMTHQISDSALKYKEDYWQNMRPEGFSPEDQKRVESIAQINRLPEIQSTVKLVRIMVEGHLPINDKIEFGPVFGAYVFNKVEGHRFQIGGRTTQDFHPNWILNGYLAYGTKDASFKSLFNIRYIANRQQWTEWGASYLNDVGPAAMDLNNAQLNSLFFSSFRWGEMRFPYQQERMQLWAEREWLPGFRQRVTFRHSTFRPYFDTKPFTSDKDGSAYAGFKTTDVTLSLRYASAKKVLIRHYEKIPIANSTAPIIGVDVSAGLSGLMNSNLAYQEVSLSMEQRVRTGILGYGRYYLKAGKTFTKVPLPLLQVPVGNETPFFILHGYNLMPFFSFATDQYVSLRYDHHFEGAFSLTNRLPLLKKTKMIMVAGGAILYGSISDKNNPVEEAVTGSGQRRFLSLGKDPYAEVNVGFKNIFQLFRVDLVHRLTYKELDSPLWGLRLSVSVNP